MDYTTPDLESNSIDLDFSAEWQALLNISNLQQATVSTTALMALKSRFEALTSSLALLRATINSLSDGVLIMQPAGAVICANKPMAILWDLTIETLESINSEHLIKLLAAQLTHPEQFLLDTKGYWSAQSVDSFRVINLVDGRILNYTVKSHPLDALTVGLIYTFKDVTAHKQIDTAIQRDATNINSGVVNQKTDHALTQATSINQASAMYTEKERTEITLASIRDAVITTDIMGKVTFLNHAAASLTGWIADEAVGKPIIEIFHIINEITRNSIDNPVAAVLKNGVVEGVAEHILLISRDGLEYNIENSTTAIYLKDGSLLGCLLVFRNVTEKYQLMKAVQWQAGHDVLTGLPNRELLADRFSCALMNAKRQKSMLGVCKMDLDDFKLINDLYGHTIGDQLLVAVTRRMHGVIRGEDTLARLGGDEFALLIGNLNNIDEMKIFLQRILTSVSMPYLIEGQLIKISASIGMAIYPLDNVDADTLLRHADQAMYKAKQSGRNCIHLFDVEFEQLTQSSYQTRERVRQALLDNELCLYYQPKVNMRSNQVVGMEALLRWQHPERGLVPPLAFLPFVEHTDLIIEIGEWVIEQALQQIAVWTADNNNWVVSVNIAARHFQHPDFLPRLTNILAHYPQVPPHLLEIEILESVALGDIEQVRRLIHACQALGVTFSLDDFGTGYSSLSYLKRLPADTLKVDQSFVRDMLDNKEDLALIEAVIGLASVFDRRVIAEGVETPEHGVLLMRIGCDLAQGYGIARPMPADAVITWVKQFIPDPSWALWANVQWELNDFPLLVAQYDHLKWLKKLTDASVGKAVAANDWEHKDHNQCRFGQWYMGRGTINYSHLPEFTAIAPIHLEVHQLGSKVIDLCKAREFEFARELCQDLISLNDKIMSQLILLQLTVATVGL
ncbi:MAG: EAL domain-containing protein [Methylococcaceae bacterium]|nr:EAL domain-containing protein [Methylococcaceae bacterium]